ncbi:MAG: guanylate kinase [Rhodocyclaceae bacterium]|nr:guanylate kinase [Rhodocyclaceae bacterium]MBX3668491.1 guanylate kinase [Rhodocyclaceae bacterium]
MSGNLFIVSAPSGAGKTTLVRALLQQDPLVQLSVSYTTRAPRTGESEGVHYHFVDTATFRDMQGRGEFLEWAEVHGNFYATSRPWLEARLAAGQDVLLEIDWQGARQVRHALPQAVGIFVLPPSAADLALRLRGRGQDSAAVIERRLANAVGEVSHADEFDYVIINNHLQTAVDDLVAVVRAQRLKLPVQRARHPLAFNYSSR